MADQNPTYPDIFVKIHGSTQLAEDKLALDIEVLAANAEGLVPHQPVEITLNGKTQRLTTDAAGRARLELVFPVRLGTRERLLARAPGAQKEITKVEIVPDGFERAIVAGVKANFEKEIEKLRAESKEWKGKLEGGQETKAVSGSSLSEADRTEIFAGKRPVKKGETLALQKDIHVVKGDIEVEIGGRLLIEAGSQLLFKEKAGILCEGIMEAVGTVENPIIFTAKDVNWLNITLKNRTATGSRLKHCLIEKGAGRKIDAADVRGGGLLLLNTADADIKLNDIIVQQNSAQNGGGLYFDNSSPDIHKTEVRGNKTSGSGGGMYLSGSNPKLTEIMVEQNSAGKEAAGIFQKSSNPKLTEVKVKQNSIPSANGRYLDHEDGTITDTKTGLMWAKRDCGSVMDWNTADKYVKQLNTGGYSDWRLPTVLELQEISGNNFDANVFSESWHIAWYWSSEKTGASRARFVAVDLGNVGEAGVVNGTPKGARAVRP